MEPSGTRWPPSVVAQYQGQALSTASQVVLSDDPEAFLCQLTTIDEYNAQQAPGRRRPRRARSTGSRCARRSPSARSTRSPTPARRSPRRRPPSTTARPRPRRCSSALEEEREQQAQPQPEPGAAQPGDTVEAARRPGGRGAAVQYALAQVGDAYVYGAAGPDAFDCSGLTMMAWAAGRRRAAALLVRPDGLRHPGVDLERLAAGRPGLLLQPREPRRHLHRQRPDRARREPLHGRAVSTRWARCRSPGPSALADAHRRRHPSAPTRPPPPSEAGGFSVSRSLAVVALVAVVLLLVDRTEQATLSPDRSAAAPRTGQAVDRAPTGKARRPPSCPTSGPTSWRADPRRLGDAAASRAARRELVGAGRQRPTGCGSADFGLRYVDESDAALDEAQRERFGPRRLGGRRPADLAVPWRGPRAPPPWRCPSC